MINESVKKDNDSKKILMLIVLIATLMVGTTGATYAYFAITAPTNNTITGTAATASLILTNTTSGTSNAAPTLVAPTSSGYITKPLVPQYSYRNSTNILQKALTGATNMDKCVDANGNAICRAYTFVVKNQSTAAINVRGKLKFQYASGAAFANLRWKLMTSATAVSVSSATAGDTLSTTAPTRASTNYVYFDSANVSLAANGGNKQYWIIFWIEETDANQNNTDKGTFNVEITFDVYDAAGNVVSGITSTITT